MAATVECPNGHQSATTDYCDQCGARIGSGAGEPAAPSPAPTPPADPPAASGAPATACPNCQSAAGPDDKFCEVCGYDFVTGNLPAAPQPVPAPAAPTGPAAVTSAAPWQAVVTADREYYGRSGTDDELPFPDHCPERVFWLNQDEILIGRHSQSRGINPQIDLSGAPEDTAISRAHAILRRQPDGSFVVIDPGSTNGVMLNDDPEPLTHNVARPIQDGDRLYLGAWTRIDFHAPAAD
jgi:hypothetical protein